MKSLGNIIDKSEIHHKLLTDTQAWLGCHRSQYFLIHCYLCSFIIYISIRNFMKSLFDIWKPICKKKRNLQIKRLNTFKKDIFGMFLFSYDI